MKSFEELQKIAERMDFKLRHSNAGGFVLTHICTDTRYDSLTPIRVILAGELEKRAESIQEQWTWALELTKTEYTYHKVPGTVADLRSLAASLLADNEAEKPKGPTTVENDDGCLKWLKRELSKRQMYESPTYAEFSMVLDALIEFGKRIAALEAKR